MGKPAWFWLWIANDPSPPLFLQAALLEHLTSVAEGDPEAAMAMQAALDGPEGGVDVLLAASGRTLRLTKGMVTFTRCVGWAWDGRGWEVVGGGG